MVGVTPRSHKITAIILVPPGPGALYYLLRGPVDCQFWLKPGGVSVL